MKSFTVKAIGFYVLAAICALTITGLTNLAIYWFFTVAGLSEFGNMLLFKIGLAITETALVVYCVSQLSEDILYYEGEYDEEAPTESTEEKAT